MIFKFKRHISFFIVDEKIIDTETLNDWIQTIEQGLSDDRSKLHLPKIYDDVMKFHQHVPRYVLVKVLKLMGRPNVLISSREEKRVLANKIQGQIVFSMEDGNIKSIRTGIIDWLEKLEPNTNLEHKLKNSHRNNPDKAIDKIQEYLNDYGLNMDRLKQHT